MRCILPISFYLIAICLFFYSAKADAQTQERFCLEQVKLDENITPSDTNLVFADTLYPVISVGGANKPPLPYILYENKLQEIQGAFPSQYNNSFLALPDGTVIGYTRTHAKPTILYRQNQATGQFFPWEVEGADKLWNISEAVWSQTLNGILIATGPSKWNPNPSTLYLLKDNQLAAIEGINGWVTKIVTLPELGLVFLGTENEDGMYLIDSAGKTHHLADLNQGKWVFFANIFHLKNPDRLLVLTTEAMGPSRGIFIISLENKDGVIVPLPEQIFNNLLHDFHPPNQEILRNRKFPANSQENYYLLPNAQQFVFYAHYYGDIKKSATAAIKAKPEDYAQKLYIIGANKFELFDGQNKEIINELPNHLKRTVYPETYGDGPVLNTPTHNLIDMPRSGVKAKIADDTVLIIDKEGIEYTVTNLPIHLKPVIRENKLLPQIGSVFIAARNGLFLLQDKEISGPCTQ